MVKFNPEFYLFGREGEATIYIKDNSGEWTEIESYEYFKIIKQQNQISSFEVEIADIEDAEKLYIKEFKEILFFSSGMIILRGRIQTVKYGSAYSCNITGYGFASSKLLDKEFTKNNNVTAVWDDIKRAQYENISAQTIAKELLSENSDGNLPYIVDPSTSGLFLDDWGDVSVRYENANRLNCIAKLVEAINYEWQEEVDESSYDNSYISISEYLPSVERATVSQETFAISGDDANAEETNKEKDITNLVNKVDGLGYGDGINQLHTSCYNASATYSILAEDLTSTDTSITLADATDFPSSGTIRIMEEQVTYTGKSGNTLTGCTRGANSTLALAHKKTIFVEIHLEIANAEDGSSIYEYGLMDNSVVDRSIINLETLELIISKELLNKMEPIETITIIPSEPTEVLASRTIGDLVTIVDAEAGISGDYRIVSLTYTSDYGDLSMEIQCSNRSLTFIDQMTKAKEESTNLSKYMQGSTNVYVVSNSENCDNGYGCIIKTYIPEETVAINHIKLSYSVSNYRTYSSTTTNESEHTHGIPSLNVNSATSGMSSVDTQSDSGFGWSTGVADGGNLTVSTSLGLVSGNTDYAIVTVHAVVEKTSSTANGWDLRLRNTSTSTTYESISNWIDGSAYGVGGELYSQTGVFVIDGDIEGDTIEARLTNNTISTVGANLSIAVAQVSEHSHSVSGQSTASNTTSAGSSHNHGVSYGINSGTNTISDMELWINGNNVTSAIESEIGHTLSTNGEESDITITPYINSVGSWNTIELRPNGTCRISADMWNKIFIESK